MRAVNARNDNVQPALSRDSDRIGRVPHDRKYRCLGCSDRMFPGGLRATLPGLVHPHFTT